MKFYRKFKWVVIGLGLYLLKRGLRFRISGEQSVWIQNIPKSELVHREEYILSYCKRKSVLHIGFVDWPYTVTKIETGQLLHLKLKQIARETWGVDLNGESVTRYTEMTNDSYVISGTIDDVPEELWLQFEVILMGEVLEHISEPGKIITGLYNKMQSGQTLLISVPNYTSLDTISASLNAVESIHPDHKWYFSPYTLLQNFDVNKWIQADFKFGLYDSYAQKKENINPILKRFPNLSDCLILAVTKK